VRSEPDAIFELSAAVQRRSLGIWFVNGCSLTSTNTHGDTSEYFTKCPVCRRPLRQDSWREWLHVAVLHRKDRRRLYKEQVAHWHQLVAPIDMSELDA
jgi:hypothetical protein